MKKRNLLVSILVILLSLSSVLGLVSCTQEEPHSHEWGEWTVETAATCGAEGKEVRVCATDATHKEERAIAATGAHVWSEDWAGNAEGHFNPCTGCNAPKEGKVYPHTSNAPATELKAELCSLCLYEMSPILTDRISMHGKKVLFVGNSYVYYGNVVIEKGRTTLTQAERSNDQGYFYQLCKSNGETVQVTNWTIGSHATHDLLGKCTVSGACYGKNHLSYLTDRYFDYVVISPAGTKVAETKLEADIKNAVEIFRDANPNVKFVLLGNLGAHGHNQTKEDRPGIYNYYKTLEDQGFIIADWGGMVEGIMDGTYTVNGATQTYNQNSFIIAQSASDGYHQNQLSGYITALTLYCALTGDSAVGKTYDFCNNSTLNEKFDFRAYVAKYYKYDGATTNYPDVFASASDMKGIQELIDRYLANKPYRNTQA